MHGWDTWWGGGGMWLGPLWMIVWLAVLLAVIVAMVRWRSEKRWRRRQASARRARYSNATHAGRLTATKDIADR